MMFVARPSVRLLAKEINARGMAHLIGSLQAHRQQLHKRQGIRSNFNLRTTVFEGKEEYAFHWGGRRELQFNIGYEGENRANLRHAVAFSFKTGRNLSWQQVLDDL